MDETPKRHWRGWFCSPAKTNTSATLKSTMVLAILGGSIALMIAFYWMPFAPYWSYPLLVAFGAIAFGLVEWRCQRPPEIFGYKDRDLFLT